jgi:hypothetical protein
VDSAAGFAYNQADGEKSRKVEPLFRNLALTSR